ncbi:hypothetical protein ACPCG0_00845 [Propionibacteriaceae bacterium Y1923]|uniref:hypothetical protein n=1 Tax=Aestuariimicrobium sp. Y1814 TaxID=3418742 RepID=UPI003C237D85
MTTYRYGHDWNLSLKKPINEIDELSARRRFADGPQLSVSKVEEGRAVPDFTLILGVGGTHVRVRKYDANGSITQTFDYSFRAGEDRLFLDNYKVHVYPDDAAGPLGFMESVAHKAWVFREDGTATCREVVKPAPDARITQYRNFDVSGHWRSRPAFGDWDTFGDHPEPGA